VLRPFEALFRNRFPGLASKFLPFSLGAPTQAGASSNNSLQRTIGLRPFAAELTIR
jgi:hypothetical protein